jgi:DNA repair exonuclease SbcCD ATPase subunit
LNRLNIEQKDEQVRRKFKEQDRSKIVQLWLQNMNYRQIAQQTKASLGTISAEIEKARKAEPDIDSLRELKATLRKSGIALVDAIRACPILSQLDELGVGINELSQYMELSKKLVAAQGVGAAELVESALKLSKLEKETSKLYHEVVREFEDKQARVKELDLKVKELDSQRAKIQEELSRAKEKLSKTLEELKRATGYQDRLQRLELDKINALAEFIEEYELLGFNAQEVQTLAEWRRSLKAIGIDSDGLESFIKRKGTLEKQLTEVEAELTEGKARLKILSRLEGDLQRRVDDIQRIEHILQSRMSSFACPRCGGVTWREIRRFEVSQCLAMGQPIIVNCQRCGAPNIYNLYEVLARLGFEVLS